MSALRFEFPLSPLHVALAISVGLHALLLSFRFIDPEGFERVFDDSPLEVILVNAKSKETPTTKAQAIAQHSLAGGGEADTGRATSPLAPSPTSEVGTADIQSHKQIEQLQDMQQQLLTQIRREVAMLPAPSPHAKSGDPNAQSEEEKRRQLLRVLAEIEKRVNEENARPKKRYVSPATQEAVYAVYYDAMRRKIEDRGTRQFPEHQGQKLYGQLTMNVTVNAQGRVVATEVVRSSGNKILDRRAEAIVRSAEPYGVFSADMRRQADQLVITSRFRFTRDEGLETQWLGQ